VHFLTIGKAIVKRFKIGLIAWFLSIKTKNSLEMIPP
jgi:hypothetical protein